MTAKTQLTSGASGRYAAALFELANEDDALPAMRDGLSGFSALISRSPDLARFLGSPVVRARDQLAVLEPLLERAGIGGLTANFIKLLAQNRRLPAFDGIVAAFEALCARARGEITAEVTSTHPLDARRVKALKQALAPLHDGEILVDNRIDPDILGGVLVKIGSRMIDTSLRAKLQHLKDAMKEA